MRNYTFICLSAFVLTGSIVGEQVLNTTSFKSNTVDGGQEILLAGNSYWYGTGRRILKR